MSEERTPSIFIGSTTESRDYANALEHVLDHDMLTTVWTYGVFLPGEGTLSSLLNRASTTDFAALFLTPDDGAIVRGEYLKAPRDNMIFELGLFIGRLTRKRTFFLVPREKVKLPSDLDGITKITYRSDRPEEEIFNAVNPAATAIRTAVKRIGPKPAVTATPAPPSCSAPAALPAVMVAISKLGAVVEEMGATLEVNAMADGRHEIVVLDKTRLGTSVEIDLGDERSASVIDYLRDSFTKK